MRSVRPFERSGCLIELRGSSLYCALVRGDKTLCSQKASRRSVRRPGGRGILVAAAVGGFPPRSGIIVAVQSGRRSQTLNKDLKGLQEAGVAGVGGLCHGHYPGGYEHQPQSHPPPPRPKKKKKKNLTHVRTDPSNTSAAGPPSPGLSLENLCHTHTHTHSKCVTATFAAPGNLFAEGRNKRERSEIKGGGEGG